MYKILILTCCWALVLSSSRETCRTKRHIIDVNCGETGEKDCPQTKYFFPHSGQITDYIRVTAPVRPTTKFTVCAWLTPLSGHLTTTSFFSYATSASHNTIVLYFDGNGRFEQHISGESRTLDIVIDKRTHLCTVINKPNAMIYVDGVMNGTLKYSNANPIKGGGALIIGQEQDSVLGGFDQNQALTGTVENLMLWYRALSGDEIRDLTMDPCNCPTDYGFALTPDVAQLEGGVLVQPIDEC